jgi:hypothetical protein
MARNKPAPYLGRIKLLSRPDWSTVTDIFVQFPKICQTTADIYQYIQNYSNVFLSSLFMFALQFVMLSYITYKSVLQIFP